MNQNTCANNITLLLIASEIDDLKLLSSLSTLVYIEFDTLCDLISLEKKFLCAELPWLPRHTYHYIGNYNCQGQYMVHRVYICSKQKSSLFEQQYDERAIVTLIM